MPQIDDLVAAVAGQLSKEQMADLVAKLTTLSGVKTQEDFDEGARLHATKNAPWINGPYTHLPPEILQPRYVYKEFPKALYSTGYEAARLALDQAYMIPARGSDDVERKRAVEAAERELTKHTCEVKSQAEQDALAGAWFESPAAAVAAKASWDREVALAAAHREYEDRNLGDVARREMRAFDEAADGHTPEIPETPKRPKGRPKKKQPTAEAVQA